MTTEVQLADAIKGGKISGTEVVSAPCIAQLRTSPPIAVIANTVTVCIIFTGIVPVYDIIPVKQRVARSGQSTAYNSLLMVAGAVLADLEPMLARLVRGCIALAFTACVLAVGMQPPPC